MNSVCAKFAQTAAGAKNEISTCAKNAQVADEGQAYPKCFIVCRLLKAMPNMLIFALVLQILDNLLDNFKYDQIVPSWGRF